jgi:CP family cyanate transporter-like MFS transporter
MQAPTPAPVTLPPFPWLWLAMVVLVTLNLRPFLTAIGPLTPTLQVQAGMSLQALSGMTLLPMALMGVGTWLAPDIQRRLGARALLWLALWLLMLGCAWRLVAATSGSLLWTAALCGAGVALVQGVLPGLIKLFSAERLALMMGSYSAALMAGGAFGAQLTPYFMHLTADWRAAGVGFVTWAADWQWALALWALPVLCAWWLAHYALGRLSRQSGAVLATSTAWLLRRRRTWLLILIFGLMNSGYASMVAWLPAHYQSLGWSPAASGFLVAVLSVAQALAALLLPLMAARRLDRRAWTLVTCLCQVAGFAVLAYWPLLAPLTTAVVLGIGLGGCFALLMIVALDHLNTPYQAGALNALMQGGGYFLAALGPWVFAVLLESRDFSAGWLYQALVALLVALLVLPLAPGNYAKVMSEPG